MSKALRRVSLAAVTASLLGLAIAPAAQAASRPTVSIKISSAAPVGTGDVWVQYKNKNAHTITVTGRVSAAKSGQVLTLYAQPFPYKKAPAPVNGQTMTLRRSATPVSYKFTATPGIATHYLVELFNSVFATTPLTRSPVDTAYLITNQPFLGGGNCTAKGDRPVCHLTLRVFTELPAAAYRDEVGKKWYFYFAVSLSRTKEPPPPTILSLATSAKISKSKRVSATEFERTITFSFRIGSEGFHYVFNFCAKDTEPKDGINLPGHHGCGAKKVKAAAYIG